MKKCKVQCQPLGLLLEKHLPSGRTIDFLSVDVEGLDLTVLKSNDWQRFRPRMILVEEIERAEPGSVVLIGEFLNSMSYKKIAATLVTSIYKHTDDERQIFN